MKKAKLQKPEHKNVIISDTKDGYVLRLPNGTTRAYKQLKAAEKAAAKTKKVLAAPSIVTANTYFWSPCGSASGRRSNERRRQAEIDIFCDIVNEIPTVYARGDYSESCNHVYKTMEYQVRNRKSNITGLIGECAKWGLVIEK